MLAILYTNARLWKPLRVTADVLYTQVLPALLAIPLWLGAFVVLSFSRAFVESSRIERVLRGEPGGERT